MRRYATNRRRRRAPRACRLAVALLASRNYDASRFDLKRALFRSLLRSLLRVRSIMQRTARRFHVESYRIFFVGPGGFLAVGYYLETRRRCSRDHLAECRVLLATESRVARRNLGARENRDDREVTGFGCLVGNMRANTVSSRPADRNFRGILEIPRAANLCLLVAT